MSIFDQHIDTTRLSRKKWEYEIERTGYQDLLSFGTADMDYHSPQPILNAIKVVAEEGHLGYPHIRPSYYSLGFGGFLVPIFFISGSFGLRPFCFGIRPL